MKEIKRKPEEKKVTAPRVAKIAASGNGGKIIKLAGKTATAKLNAGVKNSAILVEIKSPEWSLTPVEKMSIAKNGVSKQSLVNLKDRANLDYDELATILSTNRSTLINKKGSDNFNVPLSEKILSVADIYSYGYAVFEDEEKFNSWMQRKNQALGGESPMDYLGNQFGREEVRNLIGRIDYGVYS